MAQERLPKMPKLPKVTIENLLHNRVLNCRFWQSWQYCCPAQAKAAWSGDPVAISSGFPEIIPNWSCIDPDQAVK